MKILLNSKEYLLTPIAQEKIVQVIADLADPGGFNESDWPMSSSLILSFFSELSKSKNPRIRQHVASGITWSQTLGEEELEVAKVVVKKLSKDSQIDVVRALVKNTAAIFLLSEKRVLALIEQGDVNVLQSIALYLDGYDLCDRGKLTERLIASGDSIVKKNIIECGATFSVLEELSKDEDPGVSILAEDYLQNADQEEGERDW